MRFSEAPDNMEKEVFLPLGDAGVSKHLRGALQYEWRRSRSDDESTIYTDSSESSSHSSRSSDCTSASATQSDSEDGGIWRAEWTNELVNAESWQLSNDPPVEFNDM